MKLLTLKIAGTLAIAVFALSGCTNSSDNSGTTINIAHRYGLSYLPIYVAQEKGYFKDQAKISGISDVIVNIHSVGSGAALNDTLFSGAADVVAGGVAPMIIAWDRSIGNAKVRGLIPLAESPVKLMTIDPSISSIANYTDSDKIAVPALGVSIQAILLRIAAEKEFADSKKLDPLMLPMKHSDAVVNLRSGRTQPKSHMSTVPYISETRKLDGAREVLSSFQLLGGSHTMAVAWTTEKWANKHPRLLSAVKEAIRKAIAWIANNKESAADIYIQKAGSSLTKQEIVRILSDSSAILYSDTPRGVEKFGNAMLSFGLIENRLDDWDKIFLETDDRTDD